ncbi:MAG: dockerin type I domain-containing protein, partial [Euryarchaeota archaeon]|nr:dockerin type I domain-containing protein [Euryarchaeota archaeon]
MKLREIIYCALIALAVFSAPASADGNIVIVGDANSDGGITTADSMLALQMSAGSMSTDIERADVNYDGAVNSLDALMILTIAQKTQVCVNAPEVVSGAFDVTINVYNVVDLDSGQFDLSFDP